MPPVSCVPIEKAVITISEFIDHFRGGKYPNYASDIWKQMSGRLNYKWSASNVYTNVTQNRRKIMEIACVNNSIPFVPFVPRNKVNMDDVTLDDSMVSPDDEGSIYEIESDATELDEFSVCITSDEWKQMQAPDVVYKDGRNYPILRPNVWADILVLAIDRQMDLPCAFSFKNSKICITAESKHFLVITGYCKSKECGNRIFCYLDENPGDKDFNITIRTRDTIHEKHAKVERQLRGVKRQRVGKEVFNDGRAVWRKRQIRENTKFGGRIPSHIPNLHTLHQTKKEYVDQMLGVKASPGINVINRIEEMKCFEYRGFIHDVKRDKFYVSFSTPAQLHAYRQYCRTTKSVSSVSIDGTGSIVKPIKREDGSYSGHIFLYSVTINFNGTTLSVYDMLTESQDTDVIWWWLKHWLKLNDATIPKPKQAICDSSRALMNGISMASNFQTVKDYIETCFLYATGNDEYNHRAPIYTYLRLDVAHLMIMVRKWDCFKLMPFTVVCQFYQYCLGLMIDCQTLEQFREIFHLMCIVGVNQYEDTIITDTVHSVLNARRKLEDYIRDRKFDIDFENCLDDNKENLYTDDSEERKRSNLSRIRNWIDRLRNSATTISQMGSKINGYYFESFIDRFIPLVYEFPLWTPVAIPYVAEHALTAFVEGHFNIVKHNVLVKFPRPVSADRFLRIILDDYAGNAADVVSKLKVFNQNYGPYPSPLRKKQEVFVAREINNDTQKSKNHVNITVINNNDTVLNNSCTDNNDNEVFFMGDDLEEHQISKTNDLPEKKIESSVNGAAEKNNQDNLSKITKRKPKGKYFKPNPNIRHRNNLISNIRESWLLKNGNFINNPVLIDGKNYFAYNTCGFDSISQILAANALDDVKYMKFIETSKHKVLQFVKRFIQNGTSPATYKERTILIQHLFASPIESTNNQYSKSSPVIINLMRCLTEIWATCFKYEPSGWYNHQCPNCEKYTSSAIILQVNHKTILENGFGALQEAFCTDMEQTLCMKKCSNYCQRKLSAFNMQVFFELDVRPSVESVDGICGKLRDFPDHLNLGGFQYRLAGIVARLPAHYVSYCRRINNRWDKCNDVKPKIEQVSGNTSVEPHGAIYTKVFSIDEEKVHSDPTEEQGSAQRILSSPVQHPIGSFEMKSEASSEISENLPETLVSIDHHSRPKFTASVPFDDSDTNSRDNWRNKEAIDNIWLNCSFGYDGGDHLIGDRTIESNRSDQCYEYDQLLLLKIGNIMPGIILDGQIFHLLGTHNFDSIVHILAITALDDSSYMSSLNKSINNTIQFTIDFITMRSCEKIYKKRAVLLKSHYFSKIIEHAENNILMFTIDLREDISSTWEICLENEPSVFNVCKCESCGTYSSYTSVLSVNYRIIAQKGFGALNEAIVFHKDLKKVRCREGDCSKLCTVTAYPNFHIFIDLNSENKSLQHCKLQDFPETLSFKGESNKYRLAGIIAHMRNYYVAHCFRANSRWELYDGYSNAIDESDLTKEVEPSSAIYVCSSI